MPEWVKDWYRKSRSTWWFVAAVAALTSLPPIALKESGRLSVFDGFLDSHPFIAICIALIPFGTAMGLLVMDHLLGGALTSEQLLLYLRLISEIVGTKLRRLNNVLDGDSQAVRAALTKSPNEQIGEILHAIAIFYWGPTPIQSIDIRVTLAEMGPAHIKGFAYHHPADYPPKSPVDELQSDHSGFSTAKRTRELFLVEDVKTAVQAPNPRLVKTSRSNSRGSMLCYPVITHDGEIPYVISVCANRPGYFKHSNRRAYDQILRQFAQRIALEWCANKLHLRLAQSSENSKRNRSPK
ncbi:MAG: hypothetical protein AB7O66_01300 [Limisphaerales bacterium]